MGEHIKRELAEQSLALRLRLFAASLLGLCALAALLLAFLMVAICLLQAARDGRLSDLWALSGGGNHGPWRHYQPVRTLLDLSFLFVPAAAILAAISYVLRASPLPLYIWAGCAAFVFNYILFFSAALD